MKNTSALTLTVARRGGHAAILLFFVTFLAFPFYWMLITTFKTTNDLYNTAFNPYLFHERQPSIICRFCSAIRNICNGSPTRLSSAYSWWRLRSYLPCRRAKCSHA